MVKYCSGSGRSRTERSGKKGTVRVQQVKYSVMVQACKRKSGVGCLKLENNVHQDSLRTVSRDFLTFAFFLPRCCMSMWRIRRLLVFSSDVFRRIEYLDWHVSFR